MSAILINGVMQKRFSFIANTLQLQIMKWLHVYIFNLISYCQTGGDFSWLRLIDTKVNICFPPPIGYVKFKFEHCASCARFTWSVQHHDNCVLRVRTHKHTGNSFNRAGSSRNIVISKIYGNGYCSLITTVCVLVPLYSYGRTSVFSHRPEIGPETDRNWPWSLPVFYFPCI